MAKDLPYFKFIISEWNDGNITLCGLEAQGLFINLCSLYWSQEGNLSMKRALRRFSDCNANAWDELINEQIIKLDGDDIVINFLDEQFAERGDKSKQNSVNATKGWQKRKKQATAMRLLSDRIESACNIEERREEKKRGEETHYHTPQEAFDDINTNYIETEPQVRILNNKGWKTAGLPETGALLYHFLASQVDLVTQDKRDVKSHFRKWLNKVPIEDLQKLTIKIHERFQA